MLPRLCAPNLSAGNKLKATSQIRPLDETKKQYLQSSTFYLKPQTPLYFNKEKMIFPQNLLPALPTKKRQIITFHPQLPVNFPLFFKDRQTVHIEFMFNIVSSDKTNSISIKRQVSSGNLEADLLSMRYISRYLFLRQASFTKDNWQVVKVDFSAKDD